MKNLACLVAAVLVLCVVAAAGAAPPPAEAFAALPAMQSPSLSPDGKRLAFISHSAQGGFVLVSDVDTMAVTAAADATVTKPRAITWASDDTLLLFAGETVSLPGVVGQFESTAPYGVDLSTPNKMRIRQLLLEYSRARGQGSPAAVLTGVRAIQGAQLIGYQRASGRVLFPKFDVGGNRVLYAVDPKTDERDKLDEGTRFTRDWAVDDAGKPLFRVDYAQKTDRFELLARRKKEWTPIVEETVAIPELDLYGLDAAGELIVGERPADVGRYGLYVMSSQTGEILRPYFADENADVSGVRLDPYTNRVLGAVVAGRPPVWFDKELAAQQKMLEEAFPGESPTILSWSKNRQRMIVGTERSDRGPAFYLYDAKQSTAKQIASAYPGLNGVKLPLREPYSFTARDGTSIPGYLTRPLTGKGAGPLVVLPHGGPAARDVGGFDWLAHFLASRGYAVLQPNFRGSAGYGKAWEKAGYGQWGTGVMQNDLSDGVAALVREGIADPKRVCIVGASYGGYAALAGAAFTPELYRCAISIAGVSDLDAMLDFSRNRGGSFSSTVSYWRRAMGVTPQTDESERLRAVSPAFHADQVTAPVLLIHGVDDTVVPIAQSKDMERALKAAGKSVEFVELEGEDHWLSGARTRLETLQAIDRFLAQQLGT